MTRIALKLTQKEWTRIAAIAAAFILLEILLVLFIDRPVALFMHDLDSSHHDLIDFFRKFTDFGKAMWYLWPCGIATIFGIFISRAKDAPRKVRMLLGYIGIRGFFLFSTIALSGIVADLFKPLIGRGRPVKLLEDGFYGFAPFTREGFAMNSMPSGHSTTVFTLAFALCSLYPRLRPLWMLLAVFLGLSRIMVDAHFISDVLAGAMLGYVIVKIFVKCGIIHAWKVIFPIDISRPTA